MQKCSHMWKYQFPLSYPIASSLIFKKFQFQWENNVITTDKYQTENKFDIKHGPC